MLLRRIAVTAAGAAVLGVLPGLPAWADPSTQDTGFLITATQMHLAEIEQSRIVWMRTTDPAMKELAGKMVTSHIRLNAAIGQQARRWRIQLPFQPTAEQQELIGRYESVPETELGELFIKTQLSAHRKALALVDEEMDKGQDEDILDVATISVRTIKAHKKALQGLAK